MYSRPYVSLWNFIKVFKTGAEIPQFYLFLNGNLPPTWIRGALFGMTHKEYLVVFNIVQNLVGIIAVVLIIRMLEYFVCFAGKYLFTSFLKRYWDGNGKKWKLLCLYLCRNAITWNRLVWINHVKIDYEVLVLGCEQNLLSQIN